MYLLVILSQIKNARIHIITDHDNYSNNSRYGNNFNQQCNKFQNIGQCIYDTYRCMYDTMYTRRFTDTLWKTLVT